MKISKLTYNPKWASILIICIFLAGMLIGYYAQRFRFSNYRWIYQYGSYLNLIMVLSSLGWSFLHPFIMWSNQKATWKKNLIWVFIGLIPLLYFIIMILD